MCRLILLVFCAYNVIFFASGEDYFNDLLDEALDALRPKIIEEHKNEINVPQFRYDWTTKVWIVSIQGSVGCDGGKVRSLATIYRTGDADGAVYANGTATGQAPLGLRALVFEFPRCFLRIKDVLTASSEINGEVGENSIEFQVTAIPDEKVIHVTLDKVILKELSDITLTTGSGIISKLKDEILNGLVGKFKGLIFESLNSVLRTFEGKQFTIGSPFSTKFLKYTKQTKEEIWPIQDSTNGLN